VFLSLPRSKASLSSVMLAFFFLLITAGALSSVFFQAPVVKTHEIERMRVLFNDSDLGDLRELTLSNRLGNFTFERVASQSSWRMTEPRMVMANAQPLERMLSALSEIKIRRIYDRDPINISNFSLDQPQMKVKLVSSDLSTKELSFGLINPIDNSTYIAFDQGDLIYHIDALNFTLENLDLINFIDTRIFALSIDQMASLKIWRENISQPQLHLVNEDGQWKDAGLNLLEPIAVREFLTELTSLRSLFIIDKKSPELSLAIDQQLEKPLYTVEVISQSGDSYRYSLSQLVQSLPEMKFEKRQNFLIQASNRDYPFMLAKDSLELFNKRNNHFKPLTIKKLFY